jgi:hypothetical protein
MTARLAWVIGAAVLTLINLGTLAANLSIKARAEVAGVDYSDLKSDSDFRRAVEDIVEDCHADSGDISC